MKLPVNIKYTSVIIIAVYVLMMLYALFVLFNLPQDVLLAVDVNDSDLIDKGKKAALYAYFVLMLTLVVGFLISAFFLSRGQEENIIYVEKDEKKEEVGKEGDKENIAELIDQKAERLKQQISAIRDEGLEKKTRVLLSEIAQDIGIGVGAFYLARYEGDKRFLDFMTGYAFQIPDSKPLRFEFGEGIVGQVAKEGKPIVVGSVPNGYITILSGLGESTPDNLMVFPLKVGDEVAAMLEVASFEPFDDFAQTYLYKVADFFVANVRVELEQEMRGGAKGIAS